MDSAVAQRLVALNHQFYQTFASPFSDTRQRLQPGVTRVLERVLPNATILDVGCGNGQLWRSLVGSGFQGRYVGLDFSPALLGFARTPPPEPTGQAEFLTADLADPRWDAELPVAQYDTILALAVFHHLPGSELQRQTARIIRTHLSPQGSFVLSAWQFLNSPRLAARVQPWEGIGLHPQQLDPGDYLLDWRQGGTGLRYVHQFSATELESLAHETGFTVVDQFYSDGENHRLSLYQTWKKTGNDPEDAGPGQIPLGPRD